MSWQYMSNRVSNGETAIIWLPHDAGRDENGEPYWLDGCPFSTFGRNSNHVGADNLVYVPEITGPEYWQDEDGSSHRNPYGLDPEIADLVIALNQAGVETVQSCQDISRLADDPIDDVPRMGIVVVAWATFPRLTKTLPGAAAGSNNDDGWLFAADRRAEYVSVIFPRRDYEAWLAKAQELATGQPTGSGASENAAPQL
jgi:hypothetical protein